MKAKRNLARKLPPPQKNNKKQNKKTKQKTKKTPKNKNKNKKPMEHKSYGDTNCNLRARCSHQNIGIDTEGLEIKGRVETIQTTALLLSARILRRVLAT